MSASNQISRNSPTLSGAAVMSLDPNELIVGSTQLTPVALSHVGIYHHLLNQPEVMRFVGLEAGRLVPESEVTEIVNASVKGWAERGYGRWSLFCRNTGDFIGFCGFRNEGGTPEFLCIIHEKYWGTGVAFECARAVLRHGFAVHGFTEAVAYCRPNHDRARKFLEKLNATFTGYIDFHGVTGAGYRFDPPSP